MIGWEVDWEAVREDFKKNRIARRIVLSLSLGGSFAFFIWATNWKSEIMHPPSMYSQAMWVEYFGYLTFQQEETWKYPFAMSIFSFLFLCIPDHQQKAVINSFTDRSSLIRLSIICGIVGCLAYLMVMGV